MPNYAFSRLTLTGPSDAVARFIDTCIRVRPEDEPGTTPSLDLGAIVPMPPEILDTCEGATDAMRAIAAAVTGFDDWYDWSRARWGTKWNTSAFRGKMIGDKVYDCTFATAWNCPIPAMQALAALFPELRGTVVSGEIDSDWSLVAAFRDGRFLFINCSFDPRAQALAEASQWPDAMASASAVALLAVAEDGGLFAGPNADERLWDRAILATDDIGGDLLKSFVFKHVVDQACGIFEEEGEQALIDSDLARWPESTEHVGFLLEDGRLRTEVDRQLLRTLAHMLHLEAMLTTEGLDLSGFSEGMWLRQFDLPAGDELYDWAMRGLFRSGAALGFTGEDTLRTGLVDYSAQLRREILAHLRGTLAAGGFEAAA